MDPLEVKCEPSEEMEQQQQALPLACRLGRQPPLASLQYTAFSSAEGPSDAGLGLLCINNVLQARPGWNRLYTKGE